MRQRIEQWLRETWWCSARPPAWLRALVPLYRMGFLLDRKINGARRPPALTGRPILVVGNVTVGGSGKTPLVIRLCQLVLQAGMHPGVVSRGYGRESGELIEVTPDASADEVGDEPLLIARRTGVPVVVATDRCAASQYLFDRGAELVIADDGLQHHRLPRLLEICVIDGQRRFGNGYMLPAGPLREPLSRLRQMDYIVINGGAPFDLPLVSGITTHMQLGPESLHALDGDARWRLADFRGCRVNAVAGIGHPGQFFDLLRQAGLLLSEHVFSDHHGYTPEDFANLEPGLPIIMTEKDAIKCRDLGLDNAWYLSIETTLPNEWESGLVARLQSELAGMDDH